MIVFLVLNNLKKEKKNLSADQLHILLQKNSGKYQQIFNTFNSKGSFHTLGHLRSKMSDQTLLIDFRRFFLVEIEPPILF